MNENMNPQMATTEEGRENPFGQAAAINLGSDHAAPNPFQAAALGSEPPALNPFGAPQQPTPQSNPQQPAPQGNPQQMATPTAEPAQNEPQNPIAAAMGIEMPETEISIYTKLPVFVHGSANEEIEDITQTFEALRILKADDFPELEDGSRVTWEVTYGKVRKSLALKDAKATKIGELKAAIETSKEFTDGLKRSKEKNPVCTIKPRVSAQNKGERLSSYKGIFATLEDAQAAGKVISFVPSRDGKVYEIRCEESGIFTLPITDCKELSEVRPGFIPALPPIPNTLLLDIITFFRSLLFTDAKYEAIANIYWDREFEAYMVHVPKQMVTAFSAVSDLSQPFEPDSERYLHYMDIHSHTIMHAHFSPQDDRDEKATRLYGVIGRLDSYMPEINVRMSCGGRHYPLDPGEIFEPLWNSYPESWNEQVTLITGHSKPMPADFFRGAAA